MALDGQTLLRGLSEFLDDLWVSETTEAGTSGGTTLVDDLLERLGREGVVNRYFRLADEPYTVRRATTFTTETVTVAPAFSAQVAAATEYEMHRYDPEKKFRALERARLLAYPDLAVLRIDDTTTADGENRDFSLPASLRKGPAQVWAEEPLDPTAAWNLLTNPRLTSTTGWTASGLTATVYTRAVTDTLIPRHETSCLRLDGDGTLTQALTSYATTAAGRRFSFGVWVYSRTAGPTVSIIDSSVTGESEAHQGRGWEFLTCSMTIASDTAALSVKVSTNADIVVYAERAYAGVIDRIPIKYPHHIVRRGVRRDDNAAEVWLEHAPLRGTQLRFIGRDPLSSLGTDPTTQADLTMEVDDENVVLLYAKAARTLFLWEGWTTDQIDQKVGEAEAQYREQQEKWRVKYPTSGFIDTGWSQM